MKTEPIRPARLTFGDPPRADDYDDVYHPAVGAAAQAQQVFLGGNALPERWRGRSQFAILETGFGLGNNFLATWRAWRDDPRRCARLVYTSIELHPPRREDLQRLHAAHPDAELARQLLAAWPPLVPGLHGIEFDDGGVLLQLAFGDVRRMLAALRGRFDAFFLDGFAPDRNPAMWDRAVLQALARHARPQATAATWSVARPVRDGLAAAGFVVNRRPGIGGKRETLAAVYAPRFEPRRLPAAGAERPPGRVLVIGGGLAGAWAAFALARRGVAVTVVDRHHEPAQETSGNVAGLFHATLHGDDGVHARLHRAAALAVQRRLAAWVAAGTVSGAVDGLLRIEAGRSLADMQALIERQGLPAEMVQALDAEAASALAGVRVAGPAWRFVGAGWVDPRSLVRRLLAEPAITWRGGVEVAALVRDRTADDGLAGWALLDAARRPLDSADAVVLACGSATASLAAAHGVADWPIEVSRGQVSWWPDLSDAEAPRPRLPLAGDGYAIALPGGGLLCGASAGPLRDDASVSAAEHAFNVERLRRLTGAAPPASLPWQGRVGHRLQTADRLPVVGAVAARSSGTGARVDQVRLIERVPGLYVSTAFGSRGIALAAIAGELLAASICGLPLPLEGDLADAIDPARWLVRRERRAGAGAPD